ncbi:DUF1361 domain-containing protein [Aquimarina sp. U1-2]|uniref:DUF1361 domain-containing protein n=1 Tax=Aquimarina sp. U1-2 TaxID=2823141 RepID=UPI001AEC81E9|nr:DUF1361 domain-containing protein [Aquimarina sp. U1-2]MBP2832191.1 DUF1361 domain-containing protein [Aquimarina sp. U1-2]
MKHTFYTYLPFIKNFSVAIIFTFILLLARIITTDSFLYLFLIWNLFLACIPYFITLLLHYFVNRKNLFWLGFCIWLAFLPNAPYILTDIQHIKQSTLPSIWFDVLLILSFAINGMIIGFASLQMMQKLLKQRLPHRVVTIVVHFILLLCGLGIYLGRILRWNSWDIIQNPVDITGDIIKRVLSPLYYIDTWMFTAGFGGFLILTYRLLEYYRETKLYHHTE